MSIDDIVIIVLFFASTVVAVVCWIKVLQNRRAIPARYALGAIVFSFIAIFLWWWFYPWIFPADNFNSWQNIIS